jgi:hypothetical protein
MASDIAQIREMRQPGGIRYASLDNQWAGTFPPPAVGGNVEFPIAAPKPDLTIGYNEEVIMKVSDAKEYLGDQCLPLKTDKNLLFPVVTGELFPVVTGELFPVVTGELSPVVTGEVESMLAEEYAQSRNMHNSAMMLRNLRTLRRCAGMSEALLETVFDNIAHVLTISFTRAQIILHCCWTQLGPDDLLRYFSKPVALYSRTYGSGAFQAMMNKIRNAIDWALSSNRDWIVKDLQVLEGKVGELEPLEPVTTDTVAASRSTSTQS